MLKCMHARGIGPPDESKGAGRHERVATGGRLPHLDVLRTLLVAWVIGGHALLGYSAVGGWAYHEVREVGYPSRTEAVLVALLGPSGLFVIGLFFFVAGLLIERAVRRHGAARYVGDRVLRLGLPWLVSALVVWPASVWLAYTTAGRQVSFWWVLANRHPLLDSGSLWFALVLLVYSVAFAPCLRRAQSRGESWRELSGAHLAVVAALVAAASFVVRLWFPARSGQVADLHLWQWPQCLGLFAFGVVAARRGWDVHVPQRVYRPAGIATVCTLLAVPLLALASGMRDVAQDSAPYLGGWHWQALVTATVEAVLVVGGSVWLVGLAERRARGHDGRWSRGAYAAFVIQGPVLMALAVCARPLAAPAVVKGVLVAAGGIALCFVLGARLPFLSSRPIAHGDRPPSGAATGDRRAAPRTELHVVDHGGTGPTMVLVHGLGGSHLNWDLLALRLTPVARVLALDLPGFGLSAATGRPATVQSNVAALARFLGRCDGPVLVGNSMGGLVSVLLAAQHPELVRGLVLLDPALPVTGRAAGSPFTLARLMLYAVPGVGEALRRARLRRIGARAAVRETLELGGVDPDTLPSDLVERSVALAAHRADVAGAERAFLSASRSLAWVLARTRRYEEAMSAVQAPVLLVHGDRDGLVPVESARRAAHRHPGWSYVELHGVGHLPQLQVPDRVVEVLAAWSEVPAWPAPGRGRTDV
jgi:pimeloyl-ACP methyl ester carboxylesterase